MKEVAMKAWTVWTAISAGIVVIEIIAIGAITAAEMSPRHAFVVTGLAVAAMLRGFGIGAWTERNT